MLDETFKFCREFPNSNLKDVRFVLPHGNELIIEAFSQAMDRHQKTLKGKPPQAEFERWWEKVEIVQGDLTQESQSDAIINVIARDMNMRKAGSLSEAVVQAAGVLVEEEFRRRLQHSGRPLAAITSGGNLMVAHIIHIFPSSSDKQDIERSLRDGLLLAKEYNIRSISLPAIRTGWYGLSASDSASIILQSLSNVWGSSTSLPKVRIVVRQRQFISAFQIEKQKYRKPLGIQGETKGNTEMQDINIEVVHDDLIHEKTDAIVNIINADMDMKNAGELSRAIARVCGPQVIQECEKLGQQRGDSAVITSGGNLNVRHIIHLIPKSSDVNHLKICLEKCLHLAESRKLHSISLPAIGTGGYCMLPAISAKVVFQALTNFSRSCVNIKNVRIVIKQEPMVKAFVEEQKRHGGRRNDAASTKPASQTVRVSIIGKSQESVEVAINEL